MAKFLLVPLRLMIGWGISPRLLGLCGMTMLVLLRLAIGFHFFTEGAEKIQNPNWSAAPFFSAARGPFAEHFRGLVWDHDGTLRLDRDQMEAEWQYFRQASADHYGFDDQQVEQAKAEQESVLNSYDWIMTENGDEVEEFLLGIDRVASLDRDPMRDGVESLSGQRDTVRKEWRGKITPVLKQIDTLWASYEDRINAIATEDQAAGRPPYELERPRTVRIDTSVMDRWVPYFDMVIGTLLLFGLFTSVASVAAAGFLISVFLSQFPPTTGPSSTMYQLVEGLACLVLAATGAGRFAGLDFFLHMIVRKVCGAGSAPRSK